MTQEPPLPSLPRAWWGIELRGFREPPRPFSTYTRWEPPIPAVERELDERLDWLRTQRAVRGSIAEDADADPVRAATATELARLVGGLRLPEAFVAFVGDRELQSRVRSCTACYLDLADRVVEVGDGKLVHFLSDQQWVLHWLLYVGADGREAVVATDVPVGFDVDEAERPFDGDVCADSFVEFLYRFWIENEIWFAAPALDDEQRRYAESWAARGA